MTALWAAAVMTAIHEGTDGGHKLANGGIQSITQNATEVLGAWLIGGLGGQGVFIGMPTFAAIIQLNGGLVKTTSIPAKQTHVSSPTTTKGS